MWLINSQTPESLGLTIVAGEFRSGAASTVRLACAEDADAAGPFGYDSAVVITYDGTIFFQGKARQIEVAASGESEGHEYLVEDAWADLERTTYQEEWPLGSSGSVLLPQVYLGVNDAGARINVAQQITAVLTFAAAAGVEIQAGLLPGSGLEMWPSQATGLSCAEVIRTCLRFHPDWVISIDHQSSPPTLNVYARSTAPVRTLPFLADGSIRVSQRSDRMPNCVRLVFLTAQVIDGEVYRDVGIQKYPAGGADSGPGVLTTTIELGGGSASIAKQQVETRPIPIPGSSSHEQADAWLIAHFPALAAIDASRFSISSFVASVVADVAAKPNPINTHAPRLALGSMGDAPRELVAGAVHEWMREKVGRVQIKLTVTAAATATAAEAAIIRSIPNLIYVTGTTATTKIYKGRPQWKTVAEQAPDGLAQAYYETIRDGCLYEGSASFVVDAMDAAGWAGGVLNISGGPTAWATMKAPIHSVAWDLETDRVTVGYGPNPDLSVQDYAEYLKLLRGRPAQWISAEERTSPTLGDTGGPSVLGDASGPADAPRPESHGGTDTRPPLWVEVKMLPGTGPGDAGTPKITVTRGCVFERQRASAAGNMLYWVPGNIDTEFTCTSGLLVYLQVTELIPSGVITSATLVLTASSLEAVETAGTNVVFHYKLASVTGAGADWVVVPYLAGSHIYHWPEGKGLNLIVQDWLMDTGDGRIIGEAGVKTHYFRKGDYVGTVDPGTPTDETDTVSNITRY